jgi:hypothetical protein
MSERFSRKTLPTTTYVSLSEALTWIAFGDAMPLDELRAQVEGHRPPNTDSPEERLRKFFIEADDRAPEVPGFGYFHERQSGLARLTEAWCQLREAVDSGDIKVRGRFTSSYSFADARLADVDELTGAMLATLSQFDLSTGGVRRQPCGSPDVLWQDDPHSFEREYEAWGDDARAAGGYLMVEVERNGVIRCWPHPIKAARISHDQVVAWCRRWIEAGRGNGMDKAWKSFKAEPDHIGLSRDDVFRPAWNEAKTR